MTGGNLAIWDAVCTTDPEMTTRVTQRGGFTAIDAYYTIQRLTERFGPLGTGWGWDADFRIEEGAVTCLARFWYELDGKRSEPTPILTMNKLAQGNGIDEDAGKKALTDAITKWASYLGFSADVFLGKFDDHKYVESLRKKQAAQQPQPTAVEVEPIELEIDRNRHEMIPEYRDALLKALEGVSSESEWQALWNANKKIVESKVNELSGSIYQEIKAAFAKKYKAFR